MRESKVPLRCMVPPKAYGPAICRVSALSFLHFMTYATQRMPAALFARVKHIWSLAACSMRFSFILVLSPLLRQEMYVTV